MQRRIHSYTQTNTAPPAQVFPLLCPVREADWVPGWKYRLIYSGTGFAELGCVFSTPNEDGTETTWIVTEYNRPNRIAFAWFWPGVIATRLIIDLSAAGEVNTSTRITYEYTALSSVGERELDRYDNAWFANKMSSWEAAINHYLERGTLIAAGEWE